MRQLFEKVYRKKIFVYQRAFTLIELLIVISIIGVLSSIIIKNLNLAGERARSNTTVEQVKTLERAILLYTVDTGHHPYFNCMESCTQSSDPFLNALGVPGWSGPYYSTWNATHEWGGQLGYEYIADNMTQDGDGDGKIDYYIFLNDDRPGTSLTDNSGRATLEGMLEIDRILDDGNLSTGDIRGNGGGWTYQSTSQGELSIKFNVN